MNVCKASIELKKGHMTYPTLVPVNVHARLEPMPPPRGTAFNYHPNTKQCRNGSSHMQEGEGRGWVKRSLENFPVRASTDG